MIDGNRAAGIGDDHRCAYVATTHGQPIRTAARRVGN